MAHSRRKRLGSHYGWPSAGEWFGHHARGRPWLVGSPVYRGDDDPACHDTIESALRHGGGRDSRRAWSGPIGRGGGRWSSRLSSIASRAIISRAQRTTV